MALPPLSEFVGSAPVGSVFDSPDRWLEGCLNSGNGWYVLVDGNHRPVRVLPLRDLLALSNTSVTLPGRDPSEQDAEPASPHGSFTIGIIANTASAAEAAQLVANTPDKFWIVVDPDRRYQGVLNTPRLLSAAYSETLASTPPENTRPLTPTQRTTQSNTALLTYIGHELKTPLTSLLGLSGLLKLGNLGTLNARQARYVGLIQQHCRRLAAWVNTLIDLGRIEGGTLNLVPQMVNLAIAWREAYHQAALRVGQEAEPVPDLPKELLANPPITLVADLTRLQQMLGCLLQTALVMQSTASSDTEPMGLPLTVDQWHSWVMISLQGLDEGRFLDQLSKITFTLPFPETPTPASPIAAEMGHWLEWLLVRRLAQHHGGELVLTAHPDYGISPTLLLPETPRSRFEADDPFWLLVAPIQPELIEPLQRQAAQLEHRLLLAQQVTDAIEIASHIPLSAILVLVQGEHSLNELKTLKAGLTRPENLTVALVPSEWSYLIGDIPADREVLWPAETLQHVLRQPERPVPAPNRLTILYLKASTPAQADSSEFPHVFHTFGCRVLEVDDVEQASLLRRVWKPHVAVLDPKMSDPQSYLETLSRSPGLSSLPLITLTTTATQAAQKLPTLAVFPCLVGETDWRPDTRDRLSTWLVQTLQAAAIRAQ